MDENHEIRKELAHAILVAGADATVLSRRLGRSKDYLGDFFRGKKNSIGHTELVKVREMLKTMGDKAREANPTQHVTGGDGSINYRPPSIILGDRDLPVFSAVEGGPGEMVVSTDPIDMVPRPWFMREVKEGYAVVVTGESMVPVYEPGDVVIVNPRLPAIRNKNAIFVSGEERGEFKATVKRLERSTVSDWHVRQWNPPDGGSQELVLPKLEWPKALRIVGKYEGG